MYQLYIRPLPLESWLNLNILNISTQYWNNFIVSIILYNFLQHIELYVYVFYIRRNRKFWTKHVLLFTVETTKEKENYIRIFIVNNKIYKIYFRKEN